MCLFLGCDGYVKGILGVGAKTSDDIINIEYIEFLERCSHASLSFFAYIKKYLYTLTPGFNNDVVHTYIGVLVYEPTNKDPVSHKSRKGSGETEAVKGKTLTYI